jgi:hypothetical protein
VRVLRWGLGGTFLVAIPWMVAAVAPGQQRYILHVLIFTATHEDALALVVVVTSPLVRRPEPLGRRMGI